MRNNTVPSPNRRPQWSFPMKQFFLLMAMLMFMVAAFSQLQIPGDINRILEKAKSGKGLTEQESARLEQWGASMEKQFDAWDRRTDKDGLRATATPQPKMADAKSSKSCPEKVDLSPLPALTREEYIELARALMTTYGPQTGDLQKLKQVLERSDKQTDGADMGAAFVMTGAGSASVYAIAWSAARAPGDLLTANNLGVALKDMGDYSKAVRVLQYADRLKPNTGLILSNLGWAYREAGDNANATLMFEKALRAAPKMSSPYLGLGLIAQCENNHLEAEQYLRKALAQKYSSVGFGVMKQAQAAKSPSQNQGGQPRPLTDEKGNSEGVELPDLPVYEDIGKMAGQEQSLTRYLSGLDARKRQLTSDLLEVSERIRNQQMRAAKDPDNALVFPRDFSKEIMQFADITELLFGEQSNYGQAQQQGAKLLENNGSLLEQHLPTIMQLMEQSLRLQEELTALFKKLEACGDNEYCQKKVGAEIRQVQYKLDQVVFRICKEQKRDLEISLSAGYKNYSLISNALKEAIPDYYAFTNPIIERMYAPSLNEYYNLYREMTTVIHLEIAAGLALSLPGYADQLNRMVCVEPEPPEPPRDVSDPTLPSKKKKDCPLGENGIGGGIGPLSFELSCDHVKLSGGEGILWSVKRDFNKHETTIWGGVGVKGEYGRGTITAEAAMGVEITIGQGDAVKDVAFTSNVKAGLGGLAEGEVGGRFALEGGPAVDATANLTPPGIGDLLP